MKIKPQKIMCTIDFSYFTNITLSYGIAFSKKYNAKLILCHIVQAREIGFGEPRSPFDLEKIEKSNEEKIRKANSKLKELIKADDIPFDLIVRAGKAADVIAQVALEEEIDMVIAASHGKSGIKRFLIGSVTERLIKILYCPLLILNSQEVTRGSDLDHRIQLKKILVGCDFSLDSNVACKTALNLAKEFKATLHLAHVIKPSESIDEEMGDVMVLQSGGLMRWNKSVYLKKYEKTGTDLQEQKNIMKRHLEEKLKNLVSKENINCVKPVFSLLEGEPFRELIKYSEKNSINLIVLGIHGHNLLERFLIGSTTDRVIRRTKCSVLALRGAKKSLNTK